jgi:signal transduction histidine kinase
MEFVESIESLDTGDSASYAALKRVSVRLDLGIVEDDPFLDDATVVRANVGERGNGETLSTGVAEGVGLAHDAGNLLSALSLYSDLLSMPGVLHEDYREYAAEIRLLSERSSAMITRLFDHVFQAKEKTSSRPTSLAEVIARCGGLLNRIAGRRVEISFGRRADGLVEVSSEIVERIVTNLVKNAAEAIDDDGAGAISVHVSSSGVGREARVAVMVSDSGRGMTSAELASLGTSGEVPKGRHGVGLRVVRELAAMSDGCVAIASAPGEGTRVSVEWPSIEPIEIEVGESTKRVVRGEAGWIAC